MKGGSWFDVGRPGPSLAPDELGRAFRANAVRRVAEEWRPSAELMDDPNVQRLVLKLRRQADMMRAKLAGDVPVAVKGPSRTAPPNARACSAPKPRRARTRSR